MTEIEEQGRMKTYINDADISELADEILRIEYPTYENTSQYMQHVFRTRRMQIELKVRNWLATHGVICENSKTRR
jgi:hypothetical protein